ncbi:hypothetical protein RsS62_36820 [Rhizobium dioscoreae]|nr:hypothetical protein RsS62_36820 [Rhizobium dioscoreae]
MSSLILKGRRNVRLRPPCAEDADVRFALGTNAEIAEMYGVNKEDIEPITRGAQRDGFRALPITLMPGLSKSTASLPA